MIGRMFNPACFGTIKFRGFFQGIAIGGLLAVSGQASAEETLAEKLRKETQRAEYEAVETKTIVELQQFRETSSLETETRQSITLTQLNPVINSWALMGVANGNVGKQIVYHIENGDPAGQKISLESKPKAHLAISGKTGVYRCIPWQGERSQLVRARDSGLPFSPICGGRIFVRNKVRGSRTNLEATTEFLRDNIWLGEDLVGFVKSSFFKDSKMETLEQVAFKTEGIAPKGLIKARLEGEPPVIRARVGFRLNGAPDGKMAVGAWYPLTDVPGMYAATMQPRLISREILSDKGTANRLDGIESQALSYFIAFDLSLYDVGYELGTDHPRIDWSSRPSGAGRNYKIPGPDGVKSPSPVVNLGMVSPSQTKKTVATFTGGFKRDHGAWRFGPWATQNHGTHYGFIVHGVVESKLQNELSTFYVLDDGTIEMKTWREEDNKLLPRIRFARQNGVAIIERNAETGVSMPGPLVPNWGGGNWSGSAEADLRTLRAGACIREQDGQKFLIYGYFSTATPSAMARTFQAFSCDYAMLLDMNAVEHTYLAVYARKDGALQTQHLVPGMAQIDKRNSDGNPIPRFLGFSDNRDFFYLTRREESE